MAEVKILSTKLEAFKNTYDGTGGLSSVASAKAEVSTGLTEAANKVSEAISNFRSSGNDATISSLIADTTLAKDGIDRVKSHVDGDLSALLGSASELRNLISKIEDLIKEAEGYVADIAQKEREISALTCDTNNETSVANYNAAKSKLQDEIKILETKVDNNNLQIEDQNKKGEAQLDAMAGAINGVSMGVAGNMIHGGSLGSSTLYSDNYHFTWEDFVPASPESPEGSGDEEVEGSNGPRYLGQVIGGRYETDFNDFINDFTDRWSNVGGIASAISAGILTLYEAADFLVEGAIDTVTAAGDAVNSATNWLFDGFNSRSGSTEEYWSNIGEDYEENWTTFGETTDFLSGLGNITVGGLRTVADVAQTIGNAAVTAVDAVLDSAVGSVVDAIGDALGWIHGLLW